MHSTNISLQHAVTVKATRGHISTMEVDNTHVANYCSGPPLKDLGKTNFHVPLTLICKEFFYFRATGMPLLGNSAGSWELQCSMLCVLGIHRCCKQHSLAPQVCMTWWKKGFRKTRALVAASGFPCHFFQEKEISRQRYAEKESRHRSQAPLVDNWDVGGFLAFQRPQQKVRTSPLPHSPFLRRHHRHCLIRKTSSVRKTLPTPTHCRYSVCSRFALVSMSCNSCLTRSAAPHRAAPRAELTGVCAAPLLHSGRRQSPSI